MMLADPNDTSKIYIGVGVLYAVRLLRRNSSNTLVLFILHIASASFMDVSVSCFTPHLGTRIIVSYQT